MYGLCTHAVRKVLAEYGSILLHVVVLGYYSPVTLVRRHE